MLEGGINNFKDEEIVKTDVEKEMHALFISANNESIFQKPSHFDYQAILNSKESYNIPSDATD